MWQLANGDVTVWLLLLPCGEIVCIVCNVIVEDMKEKEEERRKTIVLWCDYDYVYIVLYYYATMYY